MNGIYLKVNRKGQYKNYMNGSYKEMSNAFNELTERATAKGFTLRSRACGLGGIFFNYSDGMTNVEIVLVDCDRDREWLKAFDECQARHEAYEKKAA